MVREKGRELRPEHRRRGWPGDSQELWSGVEVERVNPRAQAVTGVVQAVSSCSLWDYEKVEERGIGRLRADHTP